jgi:hypothetical protein
MAVGTGTAVAIMRKRMKHFSALVCLLAVGLASCGSSSHVVPAATLTVTRTPAPSPSTSASRADELSAYLTQVRRIIFRQDTTLKRFVDESNKSHASERGSRGWRLFLKVTHKAMLSADENAVEAAALVPPGMLERPHAKLVRACRADFAFYRWVYGWLEFGDSTSLDTMALDTLSKWRGMRDRFWHPFDEWWFEVRVEARRVGVRCPRTPNGLIGRPKPWPLPMPAQGGYLSTS